jgi:hypothetical protein
VSTVITVAGDIQLNQIMATTCPLTAAIGISAAGADARPGNVRPGRLVVSATEVRGPSHARRFERRMEVSPSSRKKVCGHDED